MSDKIGEGLGSVAVVKMLNIPDKVGDFTAARTIVPFTTVSDAANFTRKTNSTAFGYVVLLTSQNTLTKQFGAVALLADAFVHFFEVNAVFEGTGLDKISVGDVGVIRGHAVREAKVDLWIVVDSCST